MCRNLYLLGLPSGLLERRPDIRAAEQQLIAEHARVKVAYTNMFPRLSLTGQFGLESDVLSNFLQSPYSLLNGAVLTPLSIGVRTGSGSEKAAERLRLRRKFIAMRKRC
mgnify:CR=1 FL=1